MEYKVILFDADDTLFDFKKTEKQQEEIVQKYRLIFSIKQDMIDSNI